MDALRNVRDAPGAVASKIPQQIRLPILIVCTFSLSSLLYSLVADFAGPELASVSRDLTQPWHIAVMAGWKVSELAIAWYLRYDYIDLAWLTLLNNLPHYFLLNTFFGIDYLAALVPLIIDVVTIAIPFALLRATTHAHDPASPKTPNQLVAQDSTIQYLTGLLGASLYAIVVYSSFYTWLPQYMVVHFDGLKSVEKAHDAALTLLLVLLFPLGYAATQFIFVPAIGSAANPGITDSRIKPANAKYDPSSEDATLGQTLAYNLGLGPAGLTPRARILAKRTAVLTTCSFVNTVVRSYVTIEGTEFVGALGWASVWAVASGIVGLAFSWVGDE